jgi:hypothetical protein
MMQNTHTSPPTHTGDRPAQWNASRYFYTKRFCLCRRWPLPTPRPRRHRQHTPAGLAREQLVCMRMRQHACVVCWPCAVRRGNPNPGLAVAPIPCLSTLWIRNSHNNPKPAPLQQPPGPNSLSTNSVFGY